MQIATPTAAGQLRLVKGVCHQANTDSNMRPIVCLAATEVRAHAQILDAPKPDPAYFTDPNQNPVGDLLKGFTPAGTSIGSVAGPDFISYAPCIVR